MEVNYESWHAKLYRFHSRMKYGWEQGAYRGSNLCPYMRTVLFYWWLRWLFISGKVGVKKFKVQNPLLIALTVFFFGPGWLGMVSYNLKHALLVVDMIAALIVTVVAIVIGARWTARRLSRVKGLKMLGDGTVHAIESTVETTFGFFHLLGRYIDTFHDKICPHISFVEPNATLSSSTSLTPTISEFAGEVLPPEGSEGNCDCDECNGR